MFGIVMYWRTVFEGPFGFDAKRLSNEYALFRGAR